MPAPRKAKDTSGEADEKPLPKGAQAKAATSKAATKSSASRATGSKTAGSKAAPAKTAPPAEPKETPEAAPPDEPVDEVPTNRAARRAKGKVAQQSRPHGPVRVTGSKGAAHAHRMWANRRTG